ncbi:MAG: hypothetical protein AAGJ82_06455 [Bacteroidota bacterium]
MTCTGLIIFYREKEGYGYLRLPATREEFHFRAKHLRTPVRAGDHVQFVLRQNRQGYYADDIRVMRMT